MLFYVIKKLDQIEEASKFADGLEIRVDELKQIEILALHTFIQKNAIPLILCLRKKAHGGSFSGKESESERLIEYLFSLKPTFVEVDDEIPLAFLQKMASLYPEVKIISSYYHFESLSYSLAELFSKIESSIFYAYKLVTRALSTLDALKMMLFVRAQASLGKKMIGMCLGEKGLITQILGPIYGNFFNYFSEESFPEVLTREELFTLYHYLKLNSHTHVYGLIGDPIIKSLSHFVHNKVIDALHLNAVYIKMSILPEELEEFFSIAKKLGFRGLSVTMPLKECIWPYLDQMDPLVKEMKAINTISFEHGKSIGFNTDGSGAIEAIEKRLPIQGKKIILIGAGGAARAIAYMAYLKGAKIVVLNRTLQKAKELATSIQGRGESIEKIAQEYEQGYDVLINCTPHPLPIDSDYILSSALIMDIKTLSAHNSLLTYATQKGANVIQGEEMFINQAAAQVNIWFKEKAKQQDILTIISTEVAKRLSTFRS